MSERFPCSVYRKAIYFCTLLVRQIFEQVDIGKGPVHTDLFCMKMDMFSAVVGFDFS